MSVKHLDLLRAELNRTFSMPMESHSWGRPELMKKALAKVRSAFDSALERVSERSITSTLLHFFQTGELKTFLDVKYACFGVSHQVGPGGKRLLDDGRCFPILLERISGLQGEPRQFRKCYQGLLSGYFSSPLDSDSLSEVGLANWKTLRDYLRKNLSRIEKCTPVPSWVITLSEHRNLLQDNPCARYGDGLLKGDSTEFKEVCDGMLIQSDSWVRAEAMSAQVKASCLLSEGMFKDQLDNLLSTLLGTESLRLSDRIVISSLARLLIRYSQCSSRQEHAGLRDAAIRKIGNPWLNRSAWDSRVSNEDARQMVDGWLKRALITDFFGLLAEDGLADKRRLDYWLRFADRIEDMWFALGPTARRQTGHDYQLLRRRAHGRLLHLENCGSAQNNAFIMRISGYVLVEFGAIGNACYVFDGETLPFDLGRTWVRGDTELKSRLHVERLLHRDSPTLGISWEEKFDESLVPKFSWRPSILPYGLKEQTRHIIKRSSGHHISEKTDGPLSRQSPSSADEFYFSEFYDLMFRNNLTYNNQRSKGGALWVPYTKVSQSVSRQLTSWGFRFKEGKGWWKE